MNFTCLECEQVVFMVMAEESPLCVQESVHTRGNADLCTDIEMASSLVSKAALSTGTRTRLATKTKESVQVSRCCVCDGMYHTPCLFELGDAQELKEVALGARFTCVNCRAKTTDDSMKGLKTAEEKMLPILVPALAFPYISRSGKAGKAGQWTIKSGVSMNNDDKVMGQSDGNSWRVFTTAVEVCTTCRQVLIATEEQVSCLKCHNARLHRRCVAKREAGVKKKKMYRRMGRKRRRASTIATFDWCVPCLAKNGKQMKKLTDGTIETRTIAMLLNDRYSKKDEDVEWWKECRVCKGLFCLQDFCDPQETDTNLDEVLQNARLDDELEVGWCCGHCASFDSSLEMDELVTVVICDGCNEEFDMAALSPPLVKAPEGDWFCLACTDKQFTVSSVQISSQELVMICDGCDREFNMASEHPPLQSIPEGDWFCSCCISKANDSCHGSAADNSTVPLVPVTLLICDLCDGEFDMKALDPPLTEVPCGDWFCPACNFPQSVRHQGKNRRLKAKFGLQTNVQLTVAPSPQAGSLSEKEAVATVLLCNGCGHNFDPLGLHPRLLKIPERKWFCPACSAVRTAASAAVQTCVGCDTKFYSDGSVVDRLHHPNEAVDGLMLCKACRNLQVGYTRRRSVSTVNANDEPKVVLTTNAGRKRSRIAGASSGQANLKKLKTNLSGPPVTVGSSVVIQPISHHMSSNASVDGGAGPPLPIPVPVTVVASSAGLRQDLDGKITTTGWSFTNPTVVVADANDESSDDVEESGIVIICDICFGQFKLSAVVGTDDANAVPARPWVCKPCLRALKRSRKKRPRFSKQMVTEMQVYGRLLRATSEKVLELDAVTRLGNPPNSREERRKMYELVGKSVGVFLQWDKQWVMGRVMTFHATHPTMHHTIRFDDGVMASLPLYAFPLVIGTRTMLYVKVPALRNRWWPAQVLRLNTLARNLLLPFDDKEIEAHANFKFVRIFANGGGQTETTQYVSSWVPKYLCRSMKRFKPPTSGEDKFLQSVERAQYEIRSETALLDRVFQALLAGFRQALATSAPPVPRKPIKSNKRALGHADVSERCAQVAEAMVGKIIQVTSAGSCELSPGTFVVKKFDGNLNKHFISTRCIDDAGCEIMVDLLQCTDGVVYHFEDASAFSELAIMLELSGSDLSGDIPGEFHSKELLERAIIRETGMLRNNADLATTTWKREEKHTLNTCSYCLLAPEKGQEDVDTCNLTQEEELIVCLKCDRRFHGTCCDPPYAPISLVNPEDGEVLVADLKIPFVCSDCAACSGCHRRKDDVLSDPTEQIIHSDETKKIGEDCDPRWSQWRLPLQAAALCVKCIPYYKANRFCGVCNLVLDEQLTTSVDLITCSTCHHWTHADCEPDPHPAFHAFNIKNGATLDVVTDVPNVLSNLSKAVVNSRETATTVLASREADTELFSSMRATAGSSSTSVEHKMLSSANMPASRDDGVIKTAKQVDEDFARSLRFGPEYDPKVLHNYECLTCRKVRMLHILYRLGVEDKLGLFEEPVTEAIAPSYSDIIKSPMDLSTMRQKILNEKYTKVNFRIFRDDFELMCLNAVTFNSKERDFLIWREAWRFYGQGQRIFRQTAPKARMKQRGGHHYDALLVAAKRQLPNKSALAGKPQSNGDSFENGGDGGDNEDDDELEDDDDDGNGSDVGSDTCNRGAGTQENIASSNGSTNVLASEVVAVTGSNTNRNVPGFQESKAASDFAPPTSADCTASALTTALGDHRIVTNEAFVFQTKLRVSNSSSRIPLFQIVQTRTSAHTHSWLDICAVCGSAGLQNDFMFCVDCGEGFHSFCIPGMDITCLEDNEQMRAYWRCFNCKMCEICGQPGPVCGADSSIGRVVATAGNVDSQLPVTRVTGVETDTTHELSMGEPLVLCAHCDRGYHGSCLEPSISLPPASAKRDGSVTAPIIYCSSCVVCTNCKITRVGSNENLRSEKPKKDQVVTMERTYSHERSKCLHCHTRIKREVQALKDRTRLLTEVWTAAARKKKKDTEKCPLCQRKWDADLMELMQCDACERWVHPPCDALLKAEPKRYQTLVSDPNAIYVCAACRPQERKHLADKIPSSEGWRCQMIIADIQRKRVQCDSSWKETQRQLAQVERWKRLADHTPVYLYVLRMGKECLRNFAYRSLNFQSEWYHFPKQQELDDCRIVLPEWLLCKANRYMRFKRYVRGPRAAARRRERKTQSFSSQQAVGVNAYKDTSAICTIVSEAASCAALLACVHLLYGWRPLSEVVIHLLSGDEKGSVGIEHRKLDESLLKRLRTGESIDSEKAKPRLELEEEIATIKEQYDRRLVRKPSTELEVFGFSDIAADATTSSVAESKGKSELSPTSQSDVLLKSAGPAQYTAEVNMSATTTASDVHGSSAVQSPESHGVVVHMTTASPLRGWSATSVGDDNDGKYGEASMTKEFEDTRFCTLCSVVGDSTACGRLIYSEPETWVHVNCVLWSMEVYEDTSGVLHKSSKAKHRSRLIRCDACGLMGATVGCSVARCTTHYHFPCAVDAGVAFLPTGETCCPFAPHLDIVARSLRYTNGGSLVMTPTSQNAESRNLEANLQFVHRNGDTSTTNADRANETEALDLVNSAEEDGKEYEDTVDGGSTNLLSEDTTEVHVVPATSSAELSVGNMKGEETRGGVAWKPLQEKTNSNDERIEAVSKQAQPVLPVINPLLEPRRRLFSDPSLVAVSDLKKKRRAELKRGIRPRPMCYRVGALTIHSLGHVFVGNGSFHTRTAIYPLGFRSSRIFWSTRHLGTRCLYECVISSTEIEERRTRRQKKVEKGEVDSKETEDSEYDQQRQRPRAVFKITASDDQERPILASTSEDALIELRSRLVLLYEEQRGFRASPHQSATRETERNPFLKRSSWLSFALSGDYFFGFGLAEIARHIEELPYAATTAVRRRSIVRKLRQQQQRQGQSALDRSAAATWASGSRKRSHDTMKGSAVVLGEGSSMLEDAEEEQPYEFAHELPSAEIFQTAERVMEQLVRAEQRSRRSSGCARTDGFEGNRLFGTPKKAKTMPRRQALNKEVSNEPVPGAATSGSLGNGSTSTGGVAMDIEHLPITMQYRELRRRPFDERMLVRKSSIHGYGLFLKEAVSEGQMIVEYQGQMICQSVADERERRYEEQGVGSCYMFRLDDKTIIDATRCGNLARFINHSCDPKAFARIVSVEGGEKKIVIYAKRAIAVGDEVTYDYKFPIEDEAIRCDCNAPNCIGRMN